jgi:hypothetical protein
MYVGGRLEQIQDKVGDDDSDAKSDELSRNLAGAITASSGIAELERDIPARIAKVLQTPSEGVDERMPAATRTPTRRQPAIFPTAARAPRAAT